MTNASANHDGQRQSGPPRVVIVGAGFGGLWAAAALGDAPAEVVLIDRNNYHTFMPLLYQVAASELSAEQVVTPIRKIVRRYRNVRFVMDEVTGIDTESRRVRCKGTDLPYDFLVLAAGAASHYFGIPGAEEHTLPLRSLEQAVDIRNHILHQWELAAQEQDQQRREALLTVAIVGAGPTGVEFSGALAELFHVPLQRDFPEVENSVPRIVLLEALDQALAGMPARLGRYAVKRLGAMGVDVQLNSMVSEVTPHAVHLKDGREIPSATVVWTAGVAGQQLAANGDLPLTRQGRVPVTAALQAPHDDRTYVVGDLAAIETPNGQPVPMLAAAAMQQGTHAARNILRQIRGLPSQPFAYKDPGMLAVIGRNTAAARIGRLTFTGFPAWALWVGVHLVKLIGFRNRLLVLVNWAWDYLFFDRAGRIIMPSPKNQSPKVHEASKIDTQAERSG
ncbi:MAG: NAD(P)/FAD-dependent oxidoreductase [Dehalococcoidia bacterium]